MSSSKRQRIDPDYEVRRLAPHRRLKKIRKNRIRYAAAMLAHFNASR